MERGIYAAATGMIAQQSMQEVLAQNIANSATVGYKQDVVTFRAFQNMMLRRLNGIGDRGPNIGEMGTGVEEDQTTIDWKMGAIVNTNNPLDIAMSEGQFLVAQSGTQMLYTRAGNLQIDPNGNLITAAGNPLLDRADRPINVQGRTGVSIDPRGNVVANNQILGTLKVVQTDPRQLQKAGGIYYRTADPNALQLAQNPRLLVNSLEQSNTNMMQGLVRLITVSRSFEMAQRALTTQDELLKQAATEVGKV
jgi:flagellar basal-body rod protein FlgG